MFSAMVSQLRQMPRLMGGLTDSPPQCSGLNNSSPQPCYTLTKSRGPAGPLFRAAGDLHHPVGRDRRPASGDPAAGPGGGAPRAAGSGFAGLRPGAGRALCALPAEPGLCGEDGLVVLSHRLRRSSRGSSAWPRRGRPPEAGEPLPQAGSAPEPRAFVPRRDERSLLPGSGAGAAESGRAAWEPEPRGAGRGPRAAGFGAAVRHTPWFRFKGSPPIRAGEQKPRWRPAGPTGGGRPGVCGGRSPSAGGARDGPSSSPQPVGVCHVSALPHLSQ